MSGGAPGALTFSIQDCPRWAESDPTTGLLTGNPTFIESDSYDGIAITVIDGKTSSSLSTSRFLRHDKHNVALAR